MHPIRTTSSIDVNQKDATALTENGEVMSPEQTEEVRRKKRSKRTIIIIVAAVIIISFALFLRSVVSGNAYLANLKSMSDNWLTGASYAEDQAALIHDVWYNCIFEISDSDTNKYTRKNGYGDFYDDFNYALANLFADASFQLTDLALQARLDDATKDIKKISKPPEKYKDAFNTMRDLYEAYCDLLNCAVNPKGNLSSFTSTFNEADEDFAKYYQRLQVYLD